MSDYRNLRVWRLSHALVLNVHCAARRIRERDMLSLRAQMLRAAMSIPANIVEGTGHQSTRELIRFLRIASGSASELEYHLLLAKDFGMLSEADFRSLANQTAQVRKMLYGLVTRLTEEKETNSPQIYSTGNRRR